MISNINFRSTPLNSDTTTQTKQRVTGANQFSGMNDKVLMSDTAQFVMQIRNDNTIPEDLNRIVQLQQAIQSGSYQINTEIIADKLLNDVDEL